MKKRSTICIFLFAFSIVFNGCSSRTSEPLAVVWIMGSPNESQDFLKSSHLFEISTDKTIKITTGQFFYDIENKTILNPDTTEKVIRTNNKDWKEINDLIIEISAEESDAATGIYSDVVEITAVINGGMYHTPYDRDYNANEELVQLAEKLIKISR